MKTTYLSILALLSISSTGLKAASFESQVKQCLSNKSVGYEGETEFQLFPEKCTKVLQTWALLGKRSPALSSRSESNSDLERLVRDCNSSKSVGYEGETEFQLFPDKCTKALKTWALLHRNN